MKKYKSVLLLLIIAMIPVFFTLFINAVSADSLKPMSAFGYKITLLNYSGSGNPQAIEKPILVYQPELFEDVEKTTKGRYPAGDGNSAYNEFVNNEWGVNQFYLKDQDYDNYYIHLNSYEDVTRDEGYEKGDEAMEFDWRYANNIVKSESNMAIFKTLNNPKHKDDAYGSDVSFENYDSIEQPKEKTTSTTDDGNKYTYYEFYANSPEVLCPRTQFKKTTGRGVTDSFIFRYMTNEKKVFYPGSKIDTSEYYKTYSDSDVGTKTIDEIRKKYAGDPVSVEKYFNIKLNPYELNRIYVQMEIVQRALEYNESKLTRKSTFHIKTIVRTIDPTPTWNENGTGWGPDDLYCELEGSDDRFPVSSKNDCYKTVCKCPEDNTCDKNCNVHVCEKKLEKTLKTSCSSEENDLGTFLFFRICEKEVEECSDVNYYKKEYGKTYETYQTTNQIDGGYCKHGFDYQLMFYGGTYEGPSYLVTSRSYSGPDANPNYFLNKAYNSCNYSYNEHCRVDKNNNCTNKYLYYTGPNLENALVGPKEGGRGSYLYTLDNATCPSLDEINADTYNNTYNIGCTCSGGAVGTGINIFYFLDDTSEEKLCYEECIKVGENTSDEFLKCAEQFAEGKVDYNSKENSREKKLHWIIDEDKCNYKYGKKTSLGTIESVDSCHNSEIANIYTELINNKLTSTCTKTNLTTGASINDEKGVMVESCTGDFITDFDSSIDNSPLAFDHRTYINKVCKEEVSFNLTDEEKNIKSAGTGFSYPVEENGNRTCTYFINLEQWKFDYATIPARDPERRKRLLYLLDVYNAENKSEIDKSNYLEAFEEESYGKTGYEEEGYDFTKTNISLEIEETQVDDKVLTPTKKNMIIVSTDNIKSGVDANNKSIDAFKTLASQKLKAKTTITTKNEDEEVTIIENNTTTTKKVKRYESNSTGKVTYGLEAVCTSTDGEAEVKKAPENGICETTKDGVIRAENKYYTSFSMKKDHDNPLKLNISVGKRSSTDETYYADEESCTYRISDVIPPPPPPPGSASCVLEIEPIEGKMNNAQEIYGNSAKVTIKYETPTSPLSVKIIDNKTETEAEEIKVTRDAKKTEDVHEIKGIVEYIDLDGTTKTADCPKNIVLKNDDQPPLHSIGCKIEKVDETTYEVIPKGTVEPAKYYYYTGNSPEYDRTYSYKKEIIPSGLDDKKVYIKLGEPLTDEDKLHVYVEASDTNINGFCSYGCKDGKCSECTKGCCNPPCTEEKSNCFASYDPASAKEIKEYCLKEENWKNDVNGFKDSDDCFLRCSKLRRCQNDRCDRDKADSFCSSNWEEAGYANYNYCMNECYDNNCPCIGPKCCEGDDCPCEGENCPSTSSYLFRSINVLDPFPNSEASEYPYDKGKRRIGSNWNQLSEIITNDEEDSTTITGTNANKKVEYIIDLTPEDIRKIRQDTESSGLNNEKRKRAVYAKLDRIKTGTSTIQEYKSSFLHDSQYTKIFKKNHGNIPSSFVP